jgi:hypothetical protein
VASGPTKAVAEPNDWQTAPASDWQDVKATAAPEAAPDDRNAIQRGFDKMTEVTPEQEKGHSGIVNRMQEFGAGAIQGAGQPFVHPMKTLEGIGNMMAHPIDSLHNDVNNLEEHPAQFAGNLVGGAVTGDLAGEALGATAPKMASAARTMAIGDPDAAALRGLQVAPKSQKALSALSSVEGARPYLGGAKNLKDLQSKIQPAKDEIFSEYNKAVQGIGDRPVKGPDGITTVKDLEAERLQLSALNRGLKSGSPEAIQLAQQKGMTAAQLLDRETAVKAALDPELASTGIDPQAIRRVFGNVAQVGSRMSGKSTMIEKPQSYGLGNLRDIRLDNPSSLLGKPLSGVRDLIAGRPFFSGKPTDVAIREGFRMAGPKPNLGKFQMPTVKGLLPAPMEDIPLHDPFSEPASPKMAFDAPVLAGKYPAGKAPANYFRFGDQPTEMPEGATGVNQQGVLRRRMSQ